MDLGIKAHYSPEEMVGKKVMVLVNLKPAKLAGVMSEGMILCAEDEEGNLSLMVPERRCRQAQRFVNRDADKMRIGFNGNQLKLIAVVSMLVDHMAYLFFGVGMLTPALQAGEEVPALFLLYRVSPPALCM